MCESEITNLSQDGRAEVDGAGEEGSFTVGGLQVFKEDTVEVKTVMESYIGLNSSR